MDSELASAGQRARFEAVRQRVFEEMHGVSSKWRIAAIVPFQVVVIALLAQRGEPAVRVCVQIGASVGVLASAAATGSFSKPRRWAALASMTLFLLVMIANTGGVGSPIVVSAVPFLLGVAMNPNLDRRRFCIAGAFLTGFVVIGLMTGTAAGRALGLDIASRWSPSEYVGLALASMTMSILTISKLGHGVAGAYERIALELAARREELCDESEGRTRALEGIAARLAHEVKNPLAAIKGLSTHVARQATDPKVQERLSIVAAEAERLQEIVEGFLSFSRGLDELQLGPTKPFDLARELSLLLETRAADAGVTIEVRGSRELTLNADGKKLRQALLNLVLNAMQASSRGATVSIEVAKTCSDGAAVLKVADRGSGMTPDVLERIRKPYYTSKEGGSGLGIAVARGIIEQHGGSLRFESTSGRGTTAIVCLPPCASAAQRQKLPMCRGFFAQHDHAGAGESAKAPPVPILAAAEDGRNR